MKQYMILIDLDRCIGCKGGCQVACKSQHGIALGPSRSRLCTMGPTGTYPDLEMYFLPVMCQQCREPSCVDVCPTGACYKDKESGVIRIDTDICIGCQSCRRACPYDAIAFNKELRVADKCDICAGLREDGETPACVRNCSGRAIYFGDCSNPDSEVSRLMEAAGSDNVYQLLDRGNGPSGRFILRKATWIESLPERSEKQIRGRKQNG